MVFAFAGDSTTTNAFAIKNLRYQTLSPSQQHPGETAGPDRGHLPKELEFREAGQQPGGSEAGGARAGARAEVRPLLEGKPRCDEGAALLRGFDDHDCQRDPADNPVTEG